MEEKKTIRINTRISENANNWLNETSEKTGIPKSTLVSLAIEKYKSESEKRGGIY